MKIRPRTLMPTLLTLMAAAALSLAFGQAGQKADEKKPVPYPLDHCLVSGEKFGGEMGEPVSIVHEGQEFKFCCKSCIARFNKEPRKYHDMLSQEVIKAQKGAYPLSTCVVSGEPLGADAIDYVYEGKLVRFCCKKCVKEFQASPEKYLVKLQAAGKGK